MLCADDHPQFEAWRARVIEIEAEHSASLVYPSLMAQAGNAIEAAKRLVAAWWRGEQTTVDKAEVARRLAICFECPKFDRQQNRCLLCGCFAKFKTKLATEHCPLPESEGGPKW